MLPISSAEDEARRVGDEGRARPAERGDHPAERRAQREHRAPCRTRERVGGEQRPGLHHLRQRRRARGLEDGGERLLREHQQVDEPDVSGPRTPR